MDGLRFRSRRPVVVAQNGAVACADSRAALMGLEILRAGGNAADAAVAAAAGMALTTPCSTGLGGDAFCLYFDAATKSVRALNGSGRAAGSLTLQRVESAGFSSQNPFPRDHGFSVTVPGAAAAWVDTVRKFGSGKVTLREILDPAAKLARDGFPLTDVTQNAWTKGSFLLKNPKNVHGKDMLLQGDAPKVGQVFKNPKLADIFEKLASEGKKGFYEGETAHNIVEAVKNFGGCLSLEDLKNHVTTFEEPISTDYKGARLWESPPNSQGIVALMALNILEAYDLKALGHNSGEYLHLLIEATRLSFADAMQHVADSTQSNVPVEEMLNKDYASKRRGLITDSCSSSSSAISLVVPGDLMPCGSDTIYLTVVDGAGNACSFINSNSWGFGTGIVPKNCGFTLQNRGCNFSLDPGHPNCIAPNKRSLHTIIPAMLTDSNTGELLASYGVMGGFMQPQGHVQVLLNLLEFGMDPQTALDQPRVCVGPGHAGPVGSVSLEEGIGEKVLEKLRSKGHAIEGPVCGYARALFGRGHVITRGAWWARENTRVDTTTRVLWAGSDPRVDGIAVGY